MEEDTGRQNAFITLEIDSRISKYVFIHPQKKKKKSWSICIHYPLTRTMWNEGLVYKLTDLAAKYGKTSEGVTVEGRMNFTCVKPIGFNYDTPPHTCLLLVIPSSNLKRSVGQWAQWTLWFNQQNNNRLNNQPTSIITMVIPDQTLSPMTSLVGQAKGVSLFSTLYRESA